MITTRLLAAAAGAALLSLGFPALAAEPAHHVYALGTQSNSGETGTVTLTAVSADKTRVDVAIANAPAGPQPAHIHAGTCTKLDPKPKYPLTSVVDGTSTTTVDVPMADLIKGGLAVNVHKSTSDLPTYVACGDLGGK
ncbi:MAG TPA: hypothetical protein VHS78_19720 [Candidatus Elarobacter sp.]|jgi:Cu/Zn superoxide dismutase|nr:hypothetical protein [Candidatus Elarobacter sp.]